MIDPPVVKRALKSVDIEMSLEEMEKNWMQRID